MTQPSKRKNFLFAICLSTLATVYSVAEMIVFALSHNIVALEIMIAVFCIVLFVLLVCISLRHRWHVWYDFVLVCLLLLCWIAEAHFAFLANFHFNPQDFYSTYYMRFPCVIEIVDRMVGSDIVTRRSRWAYINFLFSIAALSSFATAKITTFVRSRRGK